MIGYPVTKRSMVVACLAFALLAAGCGSEQSQGPGGASLAEAFATTLADAGIDVAGGAQPIATCPVLDDRGVEDLTTLRPDDQVSSVDEVFVTGLADTDRTATCRIEVRPSDSDIDITAVSAGLSPLDRDAIENVEPLLMPDETVFEGKAPGLEADDVLAAGEGVDWRFIWVADGFEIVVFVELSGGVQTITPEQAEFGFRALSIAVDAVARTLRE